MTVTTESVDASDQRELNRKIHALRQEACKTDSVSMISDVISLASLLGSRFTPERILEYAVRKSIRENAPGVLDYVLQHGAEVPAYSNIDVSHPSIAMLEVLLAHGWDINACQNGSSPFLWQVVSDADLVAWSLEHGANTTPKELHLGTQQERQNDRHNCGTVLEQAAKSSSIATFELLRSHGAPLGRRTLHFAAQHAVDSRPDTAEDDLDEDAPKHSERMAMVTHLVESLDLDVDALDQPTGWMLGNRWGTPLCYVANSNPNWDCSEVTQYLLRKGADPEKKIEPAGWDAVELAKRAKNERFLRVITDWKGRT